MTRTIQLALAAVAAATLAGTASAQDIRSFKSGVRVAAGTCATYPIVGGAVISSTTGDLALSNPSQTVNVRVLCHLPVPEGALIRRFVMVGKVPVGEIFATLSIVEATEPGQAPFFAPLTMTPTTPFEIAGKQQKTTADLPATGSESLTVSRTRAHYIEATVKTRTPVRTDQALGLYYFEVYWN
jgi:hypothetical protein